MARRRRLDDALGLFLPPVAAWFRETFGEPTPPQRLGWPPIAAGRNTLIFAPTGSGKTLAAFLACLDHLWRTPRTAPGVRILYVSPLKALNQDVARNLDAPLAGIVATAARRGEPLDPLAVAVRTGDTPPAERQRIVRRPPDILITTPESLHLLLTSRARNVLRHVSHVLVDEIHALAPNKRGVFLSLLLERLAALRSASGEFVRVGLSATQRPLEEVARYLGGRRCLENGQFEARPVTIVDAGQRKSLDLEVSYPGPTEISTLASSVWPGIENRLVNWIETHRSTIVFTNNRRVAERLTAQLNEAMRREDPGDDSPTTADMLDLGGNGRVPPEPRAPIAAHHGSLSTERRRSIEESLKAGELKAVVATASLELGIDMGAVDLVCQVESPGSIARGLQRVGRAGHLVGRTSKGRLLAKTAADLLETAALAGAMKDGRVEALRVPANCLDVLAQQVVACVAMESWDVPALFRLVRSAYPYRDLTASAFEAVLELVSGRFDLPSFRDLRPRVTWDRIHNRLHALPGTAQLALVGGGTIPDTGQYPLYLGDGGPRLGELDEEFVLERRVGETFVFGTATWRIEAIEPHRVVVSPAVGRSAQMPFWRGESAHRTAELGRAVGALTREIAAGLDDPTAIDRLRDEHALDERSAKALRDHVARQVRVAGAAPDDRTVLVETFRDEAGELGLAVLTPFGGRLHHALKLVIQARLRERLGVSLASLHADEGILIRVPDADDPPTSLFAGLNAENAEAILRAELGGSPLFGLRFRQNAGRALLLPRPDPARRTPLWLQRLRAKDLLQAVRQVPDFPIVVETYRECLDDDLDLPGLRAFLEGIETGSIRVVERRGEIASPFASSLLFGFTNKYLYEWDDPRPADRPGGRGDVSEGMLNPLLDPANQPAAWLDGEAIRRVEGRLRGVGRPPRTPDEMAEWLRQLGDLAPSELFGPMAAFLEELHGQGRAALIELPGAAEPTRWIGAEDEPLYRKAFPETMLLGPLLELEEPSGPHAGPSFVGAENVISAREAILRRFLRTRALVTVGDLVARYPIEPLDAAEALERWAEQGHVTRIDSDGEAARWADPRNLDEVRRLTIALRRRESVAVLPEVFAAFVARRQNVHPATRLEGQAALERVLDRLQSAALPGDLWESHVLPSRVQGYRPGWLDDALASGHWFWRMAGADAEALRGGEARVALVRRDFPGSWPDAGEDSPPLGTFEARLLERLQDHGAEFLDGLATTLGAPPSRLRSALDELAARGLATNDRWEPLRPSGRAAAANLERVSDLASTSSGRLARGSNGRPRLGAFRRRATLVPEGRWTAIAEFGADLPAEDRLLAWAEVLLDRLGVLCRETLAMEPAAPSWRELYPVLDRAELRGEIRRGYFVEGLSGIQYALAETIDELSRIAAGLDADQEPWIVPSLDPANLYGAGAPFDIPLLEGGTARLSRNTGNFLVVVAGRPVLIIEAYGKRLTGLRSAGEDPIRRALALVPGLAGPSRRVLKVETYNLAPALSSPAAPWLAELGFVRDPPGMAYYAGWS